MVGRLTRTEGGRDRFWPHPPIEFHSSGWPAGTGPIWVEFFEGPVGKPVETLWLGHRVPDGRAHLSVGSCGVPLSGPASGEDLAFGALFSLSERMRPDRTAVTFPAGFNTVQLDHVQATAEQWRAWPRTSCQVDGDTHTLAYWRYAWGWAGFLVAAGGRRHEARRVASTKVVCDPVLVRAVASRCGAATA
ncbi:hypothetical protein C8E95_6895 [Pseudonocardia autotrophica]|nr:hypothetical protein C8E95_6895 [Pseudonocardia autotrophica]